MRFSTAIISGLFVAFSYAQDATTAVATTVDTPTVTAGLTAEQSTQAACLLACDESDVDCRAECVGVPNPTEENISANDACVSACPTGNGTDADAAAYSECVTGCIASYYLTDGGVATATATADDSDSTGSSDSTDDEDSTATDSSSESTSTADSDSDEDSSAGLVGISTASLSVVAFLAAFAAL